MTADEWVVRWPTLGFLAADWIEQHCTVPAGIDRGAPFVMYRPQLWWTVNHYRIRPDAVPAYTRKRDRSRVAPASAFHYRRSLIVGPQKLGKGPWSTTVVGFEGVGPAVFIGFAGTDDGYVCAEHGCGCGWEYPYEPGEPMGMPWPTAEIQILAASEDQVLSNLYRPLLEMAKNGPLGERMRPTEEFIRLPHGGRIDPITSSANSRLGNPITFALQDETGLYTKANKLLKTAQTMRRGVAGMGGRSIGTTNAPDPTEDSDAYRGLTSKVDDIFKFHRDPPRHLSYRNKKERRQIHAFVYAGAEHIDLDTIDAEAAELLEKDPEQAERFFGNRMVQGKGVWLPDGLWDGGETNQEVPDGVAVCGGFDGSDVDDWTAIRLETLDGYQFTPTYGPNDEPTIWDPAKFGGRIPRAQVHAAWEELARRYRLIRVYCDPAGWQTEIESWALEHGETTFIEWATWRPAQMHPALERVVIDLGTGALTHDGCATTAEHVGNARKVATTGGADRYLLGKPAQHQKIDAAMSSALAHEATRDAVAAGEGADPEPEWVYTA